MIELVLVALLWCHEGDVCSDPEPRCGPIIGLCGTLIFENGCEKEGCTWYCSLTGEIIYEEPYEWSWCPAPLRRRSIHLDNPEEDLDAPAIGGVRMLSREEGTSTGNHAVIQ